MEPRIQYAKTDDGVSIAFWTLGEGPPLVCMPVAFSHIQLEWQFPEIRGWYERLSENRMLVRYDGRGTGVSQREVPSSSSLGTIGTMAADLEAVVNRADIGRFALFAPDHAGPAAIVYAATQPDRVSHLLLWNSYARASEWTRSPAVQATRALIEKDWVTYTETAAHVVFGWSEGEQARRFAALMREAVAPELAIESLKTRRADEIDVTTYLSRVTQPTLVLQRRQALWPGVEAARNLAGAIPNARLALFEGAVPVPFIGDWHPVLGAIDEFLGGGEPTARTAEAPAAPGAFRTVLFTDLVGHTEMMSRLGDERGRAVLREHERITREVLKAHGGTEVKTMGDGFMASFGSVTKAVECAVALQRAMGALTPDPSPATGEGQLVEPLKVRCGLNAGEPIEEEGDLFGTTVILAARIAARAEGGEILVANAVRELCSGKGFLFADRGEFVAKGFEEQVRVYEVRWRE